MTEESAQATEASPEADEVKDEPLPDETVEKQKAGKKSEEQPEPEGSDDADEKKRETARERRDRDKAYKQRLREEREAALQAADKADARAKRILDAGKGEAPPKESDFSDITEFVAARAVWMHTQKAAEREAGATNAEAAEARQRAQAIEAQEKALIQDNWVNQRGEAVSRYADYDAVVSRPGLFPTGTHLPDLIMSSDMAGDLAYAVASDKNLHDALLKMAPVDAARELGRIEARLSAPQPRTQTQAPEPISPVKQKATAQRDPSKMSYAEYKAWRQGKK